MTLLTHKHFRPVLRAMSRAFERRPTTNVASQPRHPSSTVSMFCSVNAAANLA